MPQTLNMMRSCFSAVTILTLIGGCQPRNYNSGNTAGIDQGTQPSPQDPAGCVFNANDPFEPHDTIDIPDPSNNGKKITRCIDTRKARPIKIISGNNMQIEVANVFHLGHFYRSMIPINQGAVASVKFLIEHFPAPPPIKAGHGLLRVDFNIPITLVPQAANSGLPTIQVSNIVLSMEADGEQNWKYDLVTGIKNRFVGVWRVATLETQYAEYVAEKKHQTEQLNLDSDQYPYEQALVVSQWLKRSDANQYKRWYNTLTSSCGMEALNILEEAREINHRASGASCVISALDVLDDKVATLAELNPTSAQLALSVRGYAPKPGPDLAADPIAQQLGWDKKYPVSPN